MLRTPFRAPALAVALTVVASCARSDSSAARAPVAAVRSTPVPAAAASHGDVAPGGDAGTPARRADSLSAAADRGRIRGDTAAPIWFIEISDFQCPYCRMWHDQSFATLDREYVQAGKVRLAFLNFPLASIHPNAQAAAEAAMCASAQGRFWEMHDALFRSQSRWEQIPDPAPVFDSLAAAAGVEAARYRQCTRSHATAALVSADRERSRAAGVRSTPTFFIGSRRLEGALPLTVFRAAIDSELALARSRR